MSGTHTNKLILFDALGDDSAVRSALLLCKYADSDAGCADYGESIQRLADAWYNLQHRLLAYLGDAEITGNYWQLHLCALVAASDNVFSRMAENGDIAPAAYELAIEELKIIRALYQTDFKALAASLTADSDAGIGVNIAARMPVSVAAAGANTAHVPSKISRRQRVHEALCAYDAEESARLLAAYYRAHGAGLFESKDMFLWEGALKEVRSPDPIRLDDLVGCGPQKQALTENTELLLAGLPASNVLLYGDSGTGKSSLIKALINEYQGMGLKLIAVPKNRLGELPQIIELIAERGLKFIIFIDDLSFEERESGYKAFKSVLEGGINAKPTGAIFCVTSNRRNIVKEVWSDREGQDDVHLRDNLQEKRSLAERFGLTLVFLAPHKDEYLKIVEQLATKAGLTADDSLREQALTWEVRHGGRSGRTARQFVDHLSGLKALHARKE